MNLGRPAVTRALILIGLLVAAACANSTSPSPSPVVPTAPPTGGTLRVAMDLAGYEAEFAVQDSNGATTSTAGWDPAIAYDPRPWEIFRCCLLRTLMSYNGRSLQQGGAVLQPDLAINYPSISADGLTWTFHLQPGLHYAPPMSDKEIIAQDVVRAIDRALRPDPSQGGGSYSSLLAPYLASVIAGGADFAHGSATSISGLETPDSYTLVIHLVQPTGDLGARLALPAFAPLPAGAADGADAGYGPFLVASGPYMIQGSDQLDPSVPLAQQPTVSGYVPGDHMYLVRNPSWDRSTDPLRGAFADRIEITNLTNDDSDPTKVTSAIEAGQADVSMDADLTSDEITSLRADTAVAPRVHVTPGLLSHYIDMNLALAPFDDIHVRRAVEFATNKHSIATSLEPNSITQSHAIPDAFENGLLNDYAPFTSAGDAGDMAAAKAEMAQSPYDSNQDGVCDNAVCQSISMPTHDDGSNVQMESAAQTFESNLAQIGLQVTSSAIASGKDWYASLAPAQHAPVSFDVGWTTDYLSADGMFGQSATSTAISDPLGNNFSLIGATRDQLAQYGYSVTSAPSVDAGIQSCSALSGADSFGCWSQIDQYVTQRIVAWIPLSMTQTARLTSTAITAFDFDASLTEPSLSQIQVAH